MKIIQHVLTITERQTVKLPAGAMLVSVHPRPQLKPGGIDEVVLYARVDETETQYETRNILMAGINTVYPEKNTIFIDSFTLRNNAFIAHVFEIIP